LGEFVENLRQELHPGLPCFTAHITLLPPRPLEGSESAALHTLERICGQTDPFEVTLDDMQSFVPTTSTVYIAVAKGASRLEELHARLNAESLAFSEKWPYVPHLTIGTMTTPQAAEEALLISRRRWKQFSGSRQVLLNRLTFVREEAPDHWVDLAPVLLGGSLVSP
jgi:2'-5' RNA ligase